MYRMHRGRSCGYQEHHCRSVYRACENPGTAIDRLGFRIAKWPSEYPPWFPFAEMLLRFWSLPISTRKSRSD